MYGDGNDPTTPVFKGAPYVVPTVATVGCGKDDKEVPYVVPTVATGMEVPNPTVPVDIGAVLPKPTAPVVTGMEDPNPYETGAAPMVVVGIVLPSV